MKTCISCSIAKDLSLFYRHSETKDGYLGKCKDCCKRDVTANRNAKIEKYKEYDRQRANNPERIIARYFYAKSGHGKEVTSKIKKDWADRNPRKRAAHILFRNRKRYDPSLAQQPCERCGSNNSHAHHENYDEPLKVIWLCPLHHKQRHREMKKEGIIP